MADSESYSEDEGSPPKKTKMTRKKYKQKFRTDWMKDPAFKQRLIAPTNANDEPSCKVCLKKISRRDLGKKGLRKEGI